MGRWLAVLVLLAGLSGMALASPPRLLAQADGSSPPPRFTRRLNLSPEQKQQILHIVRQNQRNPNRNRMYRQIRGVLTPEQMQQLRRIRRAQRRGNGQGQGRRFRE